MYRYLETSKSSMYRYLETSKSRPLEIKLVSSFNVLKFLRRISRRRIVCNLRFKCSNYFRNLIAKFTQSGREYWMELLGQ